MNSASPTEHVGESSRTDYRWLIVAALYGLAAFSGVAEAISHNALVAVLIAFLFAILSTAWCAMDARRRGQPLLSVVQMIMFFTWPIAVPIYLISSRGWRGAGYLLLHAVGLYFTTTLTLAATYYLLYGATAFTLSAS